MILTSSTSHTIMTMVETKQCTALRVNWDNQLASSWLACALSGSIVCLFEPTVRTLFDIFITFVLQYKSKVPIEGQNWMNEISRIIASAHTMVAVRLEYHAEPIVWNDYDLVYPHLGQVLDHFVPHEGTYADEEEGGEEEFRCAAFGSLRTVCYSSTCLLGSTWN
jgi:hypothetical protein